jgi:hypothetical protein
LFFNVHILAQVAVEFMGIGHGGTGGGPYRRREHAGPSPDKDSFSL